jgi:hypothetical protein
MIRANDHDRGNDHEYPSLREVKIFSPVAVTSFAFLLRNPFVGTRLE